MAQQWQRTKDRALDEAEAQANGTETDAGHTRWMQKGVS